MTQPACLLVNKRIECLIDAADLPCIPDKNAWYVWGGGPGKSGPYVRSRAGMLHRLLLGVPGGTIVDHANGNGLDNRRPNLRVCTHAENMRNRRPTTNASGFKGVAVRPAGRPYQAHIRCDGRRYWLGRFDSPEGAHRAYCDAATRLHGEFARTQ
jgi:hypothetical protein